jgi:hypothetical protein
MALAQLLIMGDDRHALLYKGVEALLDGGGVVIAAAAGLTALQQSLLHHLLWAVKGKHHPAQHQKTTHAPDS